MGPACIGAQTGCAGAVQARSALGPWHLDGSTTRGGRSSCRHRAEPHPLHPGVQDPAPDCRAGR
eukprot:3411255-Heterocapsa_arctica.AAC.1